MTDVIFGGSTPKGNVVWVPTALPDLFIPVSSTVGKRSSKRATVVQSSTNVARLEPLALNSWIMQTIVRWDFGEC